MGHGLLHSHKHAAGLTRLALPLSADWFLAPSPLLPCSCFVPVSTVPVVTYLKDMINQIREAKNRENIIVPSPSSSAPRVMTMSEAETSSMSFADFW